MPHTATASAYKATGKVATATLSTPSKTVLERLMYREHYVGFNYGPIQDAFQMAADYIKLKLESDQQLPESFRERAERFLRKTGRFNGTTTRKYYSAAVGLVTHLAVIESLGPNGINDVLQPELLPGMTLSAAQSGICRSNYLQKLPTAALKAQLQKLRFVIYAEQDVLFSEAYDHAVPYAQDILKILEERAKCSLLPEKQIFCAVPDVRRASELPGRLPEIIGQLERNEMIRLHKWRVNKIIDRSQARLNQAYDTVQHAARQTQEAIEARHRAMVAVSRPGNRR